MRSQRQNGYEENRKRNLASKLGEDEADYWGAVEGAGDRDGRLPDCMYQCPFGYSRIPRAGNGRTKGLITGKSFLLRGSRWRTR